MATLLQEAQDFEDPEKVEEAEDLAKDAIGVAYAGSFIALRTFRACSHPHLSL